MAGGDEQMRTPRLSTTTMRGVSEANEGAKGEDMLAGVMSGRGADLLAMVMGDAPWYRPDPNTPACGAVRYVSPEESDDRTESMYCCDRAADSCTPATGHRQVIDAEAPIVFPWSYDTTEAD